MGEGETKRFKESSGFTAERKGQRTGKIMELGVASGVMLVTD